MSIKEFFKKEKEVALTAQSKKFRQIKWVIILIIFLALDMWRGWIASLIFFFSLAIIGTVFHFVLRYKTNKWMASWGPYKKL